MSIVSEVDQASWDAWRDYHRANRELAHAFDRRLQADAGISHPEYLLMLAVWNAPDRKLRIGELAAELAWEKSRVSHQVTRMASRGFVDRELCETDARGVWVALSAEGRRTFLAATRDHTEAIRSWFFDVLSPEELTVIQGASRRIRERITACDPALPPEAEAQAGDAA